MTLPLVMERGGWISCVGVRRMLQYMNITEAQLRWMTLQENWNGATGVLMRDRTTLKGKKEILNYGRDISFDLYGL